MSGSNKSNVDRSWMKLNDRFCIDYRKGVESFLEVASKVLNERGRTSCPCKKCLNTVFATLRNISEHLHIFGISQGYTRWTFHGEDVGQSSHDNVDKSLSEEEDDDDDGMMNMLNDLQSGVFHDHGIENTEVGADGEDENDEGQENMNAGECDDEFSHLLGEAQKELYPGCKSFSSLNFLVKLIHIKVTRKWSNKSFNMLLELLKEALPEGTVLPGSYYASKKLLRGLGLGYKSIHVCKYDCVLFRKEYAKENVCPVCGESRYTVREGKSKKKVAQKVLRHFPLKPRLQRLFASKHTASDMRWHKDGRLETEGVLRHPSDAEGWKHFDKEFPLFASDSRNVRLALASDGFNPSGQMSLTYSMWPVILVPYNLPPWICMKESFFFMSLLIPGPKSPGKDIDVFLQPLIDELNEMWSEGIRTFDSSKSEFFQLRAALLWTINDFPAYGDLSGWSTKGYKACPICLKDTSSKGIRSKICFMGHRRYIHMSHPWRFEMVHDGETELRGKPIIKSGSEILQDLNRLSFPQFGKSPSTQEKKRKRPMENDNWTKKSIFFSLPYWSKLLLRHKLDVMHIEKNICDNLVGTIFSLDGKNKDTLKARHDLEDMGIRSELHLKKVGKDKFMKPVAAYTLTTSQRLEACKFLKSVKFPDGFASNISRCVNVQTGKLLGLKSHDCHVLFQRLLPLAIRGFLNYNISQVITEFSNFFRGLCAKVITLDELDQLQRDITFILCKLERIFPPAFFDVMIHLAIHLPYEAKIVGPVCYSWMYPIERSLRTLKNYVRNKARPEGCIAEAYVMNESITFCSRYLKGIETRFNRLERNFENEVEGCAESDISVFRDTPRPFGRYDTLTLTQADIQKAQWYTLTNCDEVEPYLRDHLDLLEHESSIDIHKRHESQFVTWFKCRVHELRRCGEASNDLYALALGPDMRIKSYAGCCVNGMRFHTLDRSSSRTTFSCGVSVQGDHDEGSTTFYGMLNEVIELSYLGAKRVVVFRCEWFDTSKPRVKVESGITSINISRKWFEEEPFILASQAQQVLYLDDLKYGRDWRWCKY